MRLKHALKQWLLCSQDRQCLSCSTRETHLMIWSQLSTCWWTVPGEGISLYKYSLDRWEGPYPFPLTSYFCGYICCSESPVCFSLWSTMFCSFLHLLFMQCCFILLPSSFFHFISLPLSPAPVSVSSQSPLIFSQPGFCLSPWFTVLLHTYPHLDFVFPSLFINFVFCTIPITASFLV